MLLDDHFVYRYTLLLVFSISIVTCGGGSSGGDIPEPPKPRNSCNANQLQNVKKSCVDAIGIDITNDGEIDGLDLNNDKVPELIYISANSTSTQKALDINGDGITDYYMLIGVDGKKEIHLNKNSTITTNDDLVYIETDDKNKIIGFNDSITNKNILETIYSDKTLPTATITPDNGALNTSVPSPVIKCNDLVACNSIAYTINSVTAPDFDIRSTEIIVSTGKSTTIILPSTPIATYTIQYIVRDSAGNVSSVKSTIIRVNENGCSSNLIAIAKDIQVTRGLAGITLDGSKSTIGNGGSITKFMWSQIINGDEVDATTIDFTDTALATPKIIIPNRVSTLTFSLVIEDQAACQSATEMKVYVLEDPNLAVYVDGNIGLDDPGNGTRAKPFKSITYALLNTVDADIYVARLQTSTASYSEATLQIPNNISLYGGFDSTWNRDVNLKTIFANTITNGDLIGINFNQVNSNATLSGFKIKTLDAINFDTNNIGVKISSGSAKLIIQNNSIITGNAGDVSVNPPTNVGYSSSYGILSNIASIEIKNNSITSGSGGNGRNGDNGLNGAPGKAGGDGVNGLCKDWSGNNRPNVPGGIGSVSGNNDGGFGGIVIFTGIALAPTPESGGDGVGPNSCVSLGGKAPNAINLTGIDGVTATCNQALATVPKHQIVAGSNFGNFTSLIYYIPNNNGIDGRNGNTGFIGGGGGGGSSMIRKTPSTGSTFTTTSRSGGSGGGGGNGGNAGLAGSFGSGGGGSFGIVLSSGTTLTKINNNTIQSSSGGGAGTAGNGGLGGLGGLGGTGGLGAGKSGNGNACTQSDFGGSGGKGQNGTNGSSGSDASAGGGGPSIGIYIAAGKPNIINNVITAGNAGTGGNTRHGAAGSGGYSFGIYDVNLSSTNPNITSNTINVAAPAAGGIQTGGTKTPGSIGISSLKY